MGKIILIALLMVAGCSSAKKQMSPPAINSAMASTTPIPTPAPTLESVLTCKKDEKTRELQVVKNADGCKLNYTKSGKTSAVSSSSHGTKHCVDSKNKIRTKLEKSGYHCE